MNDDVYYVERLPRHPLLGRHVRHDPRSRRYPFDITGLTLRSVRHTRRIPVLNQGQLGSCTGNAGIGALGTDPFWSTLANVPGGRGEGSYVAGLRYSFDENGAVQLYSDATKADDYPGQYPPMDTGSDGLTIAKVLQRAGEISGYTHTFSLDDALKALTQTPFITGTSWFDGMFDPDPDGRVRPTGSLAGGHEYVADELDVEQQRVWFTNSWGPDWGVGGRFYLTWDDYGVLLGEQGDVTIFTPLTQPAPTPTPAPGDVDQAFANVLHAHGDRWLNHPHVADNAHAAHAARLWLQAKGL